ncbi:alpha/beta fold hydrolase [Plantactinospora siamensis]|uniref:Alpha/beta fold hydrolase n=1 Tax=Plantactinospora siamensis TaxID=555372 RepID=A0ABV6P449_9ACTN
MSEVELRPGVIAYTDTGGPGPVLVLLTGLFVGGSVWRGVVDRLRGDFRCVVPELPLGAHRRPMRAGADLSGRGLARLVADLLTALDLRDVTLVGLDWGGAQLLVAEGLDERVGRLVLLPQEAFDNFPPGLPGRFVRLAARMPGGLAAALRPLRWRPARRMPFTFGWMSKRPVPDEIMDAWFEPALTSAEVRRDVRAYLLASRRGEYLRAAERLSRFDRPALVVWSPEDRIMPPEHGERLAARLPRARLVRIPDSYTLIPEDQPARCAQAIRAFALGGG